VEEVVNTVKRLDYLNMLLLLTYADLASIGPDIWTEWKDYLLWQLYYKAYERLMFMRARNPESRHEVAPIRRKLEQLLGNEVDSAAVSRHLELLPEKYVLYTRLDQIRRHLQLIGQLHHDEVVFAWIDHPEKRYCDLLVVTRDRPGLFARIAGGLATFNLSILSAQLNTRKDKVVCDVFQVTSRVRQGRLQREDYPRIEKFLKRAVAGQVNLEEPLKNSLRASGAIPHGHFPPRVQTDNLVSPSATVIEIQAEDMVGLGYRIASVLAEMGLNIVFAKLATEKAQALDIFYVQDRQGRKIHEPRLLREITEELQRVLAAPPG
jgi:[protein-PII] uridylyltransferase